MAEVVTGIGMSHAPGLLGWPDAPPADVRNRISAAVSAIRSQLDEARPDVIIAFLDDHFDNHFRNLMPTFAIGVAESHGGPGEHYLEMLRLEKKEPVPSSFGLADHLLREVLMRGFDLARMGEIEYGNNLMVPLHLIRPQLDIPVIPIFINVFTPPLCSVSRAYALGEAVRASLDNRPERVAVLATGGLSHWPPIWNERSDEDEFMLRMKRFQTEGRSVLDDDPNLLTDLGNYEIEMAAKSDRPLVNAEWDQRFLDALAQGDVNWMKSLTYEEVEVGAGHGGHEILNWVALMGAMNGVPARVLDYEPVIEWICGMGFAVYDG